MARYFCPRCGRLEIIEYDELFDCTECKDEKGMPLEFDKEDFRNIEDKSNILSVQEKLAFFNALGLDKLGKKKF